MRIVRIIFGILALVGVMWFLALSGHIRTG